MDFLALEKDCFQRRRLEGNEKSFSAVAQDTQSGHWGLTSRSHECQETGKYSSCMHVHTHTHTLECTPHRHTHKHTPHSHTHSHTHTHISCNCSFTLDLFELHTNQCLSLSQFSPIPRKQVLSGSQHTSSSSSRAVFVPVIPGIKSLSWNGCVRSQLRKRAFRRCLKSVFALTTCFYCTVCCFSAVKLRLFWSPDHRAAVTCPSIFIHTHPYLTHNHTCYQTNQTSHQESLFQLLVSVKNTRH